MLSNAAKILYYHLCRWSNIYTYRHPDYDGWFYMGNQQLAEDSGLTERTITSAKKELVEKFFIETLSTKKQHEKTNYRIRQT